MNMEKRLSEKQKILCLICARAGSKGLPGKNIRLLNGIPLIGWSIRSAKESGLFDRIVVSTDSQNIADTAIKYHAEIPFMRPGHLAQDNSPEWKVWQHALKELENGIKYKPDVVVVLPPTSPLRSEKDIINSIEMLNNSYADIVISVSSSKRNPYFNMVEIDSEGFAGLSKQTRSNTFRRQDAPDVYDMTTVVYAAKTDFVLAANGIFEGKVKAVIVPEERSIDIDTELDFRFAEFMIAEELIKPI